MECTNYAVGVAPALTLTKDLIVGKLMPVLSFTDCVAMAGVCSQWRVLIRPNLLSQIVFGKKQWEQIPGIKEVSDEPVLTEDQKIRLIARFAGVCPFFNQPDPIKAHRFQDETIKRFWQTFRVIFIPEKINGKDVDINLIGQVFSFTKTEKDEGIDKIKFYDDDRNEIDNYAYYEVGSGTGFDEMIGNETSDFRKKKAERGYFLIVSLDVVPASRKKTYVEKEQLLHAKQFRAPTPLEAAIMIFVLNIEPSKEGKGYFFELKGDQECTYTATDTIYWPCFRGDSSGRICVGGASSSGTGVSDYGNAYEDEADSGDVGLAAVAEI